MSRMGEPGIVRHNHFVAQIIGTIGERLGASRSGFSGCTVDSHIVLVLWRPIIGERVLEIPAHHCGDLLFEFIADSNATKARLQLAY